MKDRGRESASPSPRTSGFVTSQDKRGLRVWLEVQTFRWEMPLGYLAVIYYMGPYKQRSFTI